MNSGTIIGIVVIIALLGGGFMFRKQIQAFIEKHTSGSGSGSGSDKVDENGLPYMPLSEGEWEALGKMETELEKIEAQKSALARSYY